MAQSRRMLAQPIRTLAFGSIGASYAAIGNAMNFMVRILLIQNLTDADLMFSFTGNTDHIALPAGGFVLLDLTANQIPDSGFFVSEGTILYVKQIDVPTTGSVYVSAFYAAPVAREN